MLFDVLTGILNVFFVIICMLYLFRAKFRFFKLNIHGISGYLLLLITLIHVNVHIINPSFSVGFLTFYAMILVTVTGILKRKFMKVKMLYNAHVFCVGIFIVTLIIHVAQQIINLLIM